MSHNDASQAVIAMLRDVVEASATDEFTIASLQGGLALKGLKRGYDAVRRGIRVLVQNGVLVRCERGRWARGAGGKQSIKGNVPSAEVRQAIFDVMKTFPGKVCQSDVVSNVEKKFGYSRSSIYAELKVMGGLGLLPRTSRSGRLPSPRSSNTIRSKRRRLEV